MWGATIALRLGKKVTSCSADNMTSASRIGVRERPKRLAIDILSSALPGAICRDKMFSRNSL
jgi:hypothetical protein